MSHRPEKTRWVLALEVNEKLAREWQERLGNCIYKGDRLGSRQKM